MTIFFRNLAKLDLNTTKPLTEQNDIPSELTGAYYQPRQLTQPYKTTLFEWLNAYQKRVQKDSTSQQQRRTIMDAVNPKYVLRNYLAQLAIDKAEQGDNSMVNELLELLSKPYDEQPSKEQYAEKRPEWARTKAGCSMLSCSS